MAEYIEREAALKCMYELVEARRAWISDARGEIHGLNASICAIEDIPAADVAPVRHGRWIFEATDISSIKQRWIIWKCSECSARRTAGWEFKSEGKKPTDNYCPNCGARMDVDEDE